MIGGWCIISYKDVGGILSMCLIYYLCRCGWLVIGGIKVVMVVVFIVVVEIISYLDPN